MATKANCVQLEPLRKYVDAKARTAASPLAAGKYVTIRNGNGTLTSHKVGSPIPSLSRAWGSTLKGKATPTARRRPIFLTAFADPTITDDGAGNLIVDAPGTGGHGYDLSVTVPSIVQALEHPTSER